MRQKFETVKLALSETNMQLQQERENFEKEVDCPFAEYRTRIEKLPEELALIYQRNAAGDKAADEENKSGSSNISRAVLVEKKRDYQECQKETARIREGLAFENEAAARKELERLKKEISRKREAFEKERRAQERLKQDIDVKQGQLKQEQEKKKS